MNVILKNNIFFKFFACILIALFCSFVFFTCNVYATDFETDEQGYILESSLASYSNLISDFNYFVLVCGKDYVRLYRSNTPFCVVYYSQSNSYDLHTTDDSSFDEIDYDMSNNCWFTETIFHPTAQNLGTASNPYAVIRSSNQDLYDNNNNLVFQAPPQQVEATTILTPIVQEQEMKPLEEIIQILPIIIVVLVGLIAIRKAIMWLMKVVKRTIVIFLQVY